MKSKTPQFLKDFESRLRSTKAVRFLRMRFDRKYAARLRNVNMEQHFNATPSRRADTSAQQSLTAALQSEFRLDPVLFFTPNFNIIIPTLMLRKMSGGPNTILAFGAHLAARGHRVRFISLNEGCEKNLSALMTHIRDVSGIHFDDQLITFVDGSASRSSPVPIGSRDRFMATAWWTFADTCAGAKLTKHKIPYYFKQDFEEVFYEGSEQQTECRATYLAQHHAIYNTSTLKSFFDNHFYVLPQDDRRATAQFFQPAFAADKFYPVGKNGKIRILFYARPNTAPRNLYRMGLRALDYLSASGFLAANEVEVFRLVKI